MLKYKFIDPSEVARIEFELRSSQEPRRIKRALQDLCGHYERRLILSDATVCRSLIHGHLHSNDVFVRRWSFKALGLIAHPDDTRRIIDRLRIEIDREAQTWGTAALIQNAKDRSLKQICEEAHLESDTPVLLAARLYAPDSWIEENAGPITVSLNSDDLTLKWAIFLAGYDKAPLDLFDPRHANDVFLGKLNQHDNADVAEYSVWALWERDEFDCTKSPIKLLDVGAYKPSIRKWLYRLMSKTPEASGLDHDALLQLTADPDISAREGLARGVCFHEGTIYDDAILRWFGNETTPAIRDILLAGMARRGGREREMAELVKLEFSKAPALSGLRHSLLANSARTPLYRELRQIEATDAMYAYQAQGLLEFGNTYIIGSVNMGNTLNVGGNLSAQNIALGDMIGSANQAIQAMTNSADADVLKQVAAFLAKVDSNVVDTKDAYAVLKLVASNPTQENKKSLLESVTSVGEKAVAFGSAVAGYADLVGLLSSWLS